MLDEDSNYSWEIQLNVNESNYRALQLILQEKLVFTWDYLNTLPYKDHLIFLSLVPKKAFFVAVCKNQNDNRFRKRHSFFLWNYVFCMGLLCWEKTWYLHTAWKVSKYGVFSGMNTGKWILRILRLFMLRHPYLIRTSQGNVSIQKQGWSIILLGKISL